MGNLSQAALPREHSPRQNELLVSLSEDLQRRLFPHLELVFLPMGRILFEPGATVRHVYFPTDSLIALLCLLEDGAANEISVVGHEGMVGTCSFMGGESSPRRAAVECPGFAYRLTKLRLMEEFDRHGELLQVMLRYVGTLVTQVSQVAACNRHHSIEQQLCRLLLQCLDRVPNMTLALTHGILADMLGVRRESISSAAHDLRTCGLIEYQRGQLTILDRDGLEARTCECYRVIRASAVHRPRTQAGRVVLAECRSDEDGPGRPCDRQRTPLNA